LIRTETTHNITMIL